MRETGRRHGLSSIFLVCCLGQTPAFPFSFASVTNTPGREIDFESSVEPRQEEPGTEMLDAAVPCRTVFTPNS